MSFVKFSANKSIDRKILSESNIDLNFLTTAVSLIFKEISPKCRKDLKVNIILINKGTSYYSFTNTVFISSTTLDNKKTFIKHLLHEFYHLLQYQIDKVNCYDFVSYIEGDSNFNAYYNNITEVQAREFEKYATFIFNLEKQLNKIKGKLTKII